MHRLPRIQRPGWLDVLLAGWLPGGLLGAHLAGLLFFLNPDLPFAVRPVLRGVGAYSLLLGGVSLALQLPWLWGRPARARRWLPWGLTAALGGAALLDWTHASIFAYFLPPGINIRLIKTAFWLSLGLVIGFYTALLHTLHRRPYGLRSRLGYGALVILSLYVMVERREAYRPPAPASPLPSVVEPGQRLDLFVVGLDGATLDALLPLAEQGNLPFFAHVLRQGAYGRLTSLTPNRWRALWTTLATGKYPYKHGVLGYETFEASLLSPGGRFHLLPLGVGFRRWGLLGSARVTGVERSRALRLWEILPRVGVGAGVLGWPGSSEHPSGSPRAQGVDPQEPAFAVSERFFANPAAEQGTRPEELAARARLFRLAPEDLDPALVARFTRGTAPTVFDEVAQDLWRESLGTFLLEQYRDVRGFFVLLPGLASVSEATFGGYAAVQFEGSRARDSRRAAEVLTAYYEHLDDCLERLWERRRGPAILAVVSAFGTEEAGGWQRLWAQIAGDRRLLGQTGTSPDGVLLLYGNGIEAGALLTDAGLVDVVPTLIYGLGLPIARDLDGKILTAAFERGFLANHPLTFVPSYETLRDARRGAAAR